MAEAQNVATIGEEEYATLQEAVDDAYNMIGDVTISLTSNVTGFTIIHQKEELNLTIDGGMNNLYGNIVIDGDGRTSGTETLTIKNIFFCDDNTHFCMGTDAFIFVPNTMILGTLYYTGKYNSAHNISISNCTFTSTSYNHDVIGFNSCSGDELCNVIIRDNIGHNLHSLAQLANINGGCITDNIIENSVNFVNIIEGTGGFSISGNTFTSDKNADGYSIREDGTSTAILNLSNNEFTASNVIVLGSGTSDTKGIINVISGRYIGNIIKSETATGKIVISGGHFSAKIGDANYVEFIAEGETGVNGIYPEDETAPNGIGTAIVTITDSIGAIHNYVMLEEAFNAATDGSTITLLADCSGNGISIYEDTYSTGLVVDFNGFTYTVNGMETTGSSGSKIQAFQLENGNTITFENGSIVVDNSDILMIIQNCANLTLDGMTLDATEGMNSIGYVLTTNNGITLIYNTKITSKDGEFAFNVNSDCNNYASNHVEVTGESVINGNIEVAFEDKTESVSSFLRLISGIFNGNIILGTNADNCTIIKSDNIEIEAPASNKWVSNGDGTSTLRPCEYVAQIGEVKYETLAEAVAAVPNDGTETTITMIADTQKRLWKTVAHRGNAYGVAGLKENTLGSFHNAVIQGFDMVELDVRRCSDGIFVLNHNATISDIEGNQYTISEITSQEATEIVVSRDDVYGDQKVPTLEEALKLCYHMGIGCMIDMKDGYTGATDIVNLVLRYGMQGRVYYGLNSGTSVTNINAILTIDEKAKFFGDGHPAVEVNGRPNWGHFSPTVLEGLPIEVRKRCVIYVYPPGTYLYAPQKIEYVREYGVPLMILEVTKNRVKDIIDFHPEYIQVATISNLADVLQQINNNGSNLTIDATKNVVLDLNGYQFVGYATSNSSTLITNNGTLTIKDSSDTNADGTGTGKLINYAGKYSSCTIINNGTLTITSGYIENKSSSSATYAVDNNSSDGNAILTINGGILKATSVAVREFANSTTFENTINMTAGTIEAEHSGIFIQLSDSDSSKAVKASLNVTGGTISGDSYAIYDNSYGNDFTATQYILNGGIYNGSIISQGANITITDGIYNNYVIIQQTNSSNVAVFGGKFGGDVYTYGDNASEGFISGGVFASKTFEHDGEVTNCKWILFLLDGYILTDNTNEETKIEYPYVVKSKEEVGVFDLYDSEDYNREETVWATMVIYKRSFSAKVTDHYQPWFIPFDYIIKEEDAEYFQFYKIHLISASDQESQDAEVTDNTLVFIHIEPINPGTVLKANRPYIVRPKAVLTDYEFVSENVVLNGVSSGSRLSMSTSEFNYDFYGTYTQYQEENQIAKQWISLNVNGNTFWNKVTSYVPRYRWYIKVTPNISNDDYSKMNLVFFEDGVGVTKNSQIAGTESEIVSVYTLDGVKVKSFKKGLNIIKFSDGRIKKINIR